MTQNPESQTDTLTEAPDVEHIQKLIAGAPIGNYIGEDGARIMAEHACNVILLKDGDYLFRRGERTTSFYLVESGRVARIKDEVKDKKVRVLHTLHKGDLVGELSFIDQMDHVRSVIALGDARVLQFRAEDIQPLITEHPQLMFDFMRAVIKRVHHTVNDISKQQLALADYISTGGKGRS